MNGRRENGAREAVGEEGTASMPTRLEEIRDLYRYNRWANERTLRAVEALDARAWERDLGSSYPSVRDTLTHIVASEWVWLSRWQGTSPTGWPEDWDVSTLPRLRERWREIDAERERLLEGLDEADLGAVVEYRNTKGDRFAQPLWQLLRHLANHSTYHRGQVTTMLRQLGATPVATDLVVYHRERAGD